MFLSKYGGQEADFDSHLLPTRRSNDVVAINWLVLLTANDNNVNDLQRKLSLQPPSQLLYFDSSHRSDARRAIGDATLFDEDRRIQPCFVYVAYSQTLSNLSSKFLSALSKRTQLTQIVNLLLWQSFCSVF